MYQYKRIGDLLLEKGVISIEQLHAALRKGHSSRKRLGEVLVELGFANEEQITHCLAEQYGFKTADPDSLRIDSAALLTLDAKYALAHLILPIASNQDTFECVIADPIDVEATDFLSVLTRRTLVVYIAPPRKLREAIREAYGIKTGRKSRKQPSVQPDRVAILDAIRSRSEEVYGSPFVMLAQSVDVDRKAA